MIRNQLLADLKGLEAQTVADKIIIAYEPVWAIGTGKTASKEDAEEVCKFIRSSLATLLAKAPRQKWLILYGGSVKPENTAAILSEQDIDGVLVGGASLKPDSFMAQLKPQSGNNYIKRNERDEKFSVSFLRQ